MVLFSPCYLFCVHSPYLILILDSHPLFLSCSLSPLPLNSIHHHPFWLCTHCHTLTWHSIPFYYLITRLLHIWCHTMLLAGHLDLNFCLLFFPLPTFSHIKYIVSLLDSNHINPLCWPCQGAGNCGPLFPLFASASEVPHDSFQPLASDSNLIQTNTCINSSSLSFHFLSFSFHYA